MAATCTVEDLKRNPGAIIAQVKASKEPVYIDQSGKATVLLLDADTYLTNMQALSEFKRIYSSDIKGKPLDSVMAEATRAAAASTKAVAESAQATSESAQATPESGFFAGASGQDITGADNTDKAPDEGKKVGWKCTLCGYIIYTDELPDDFMCPTCGAGKDMFEKVLL